MQKKFTTKLEFELTDDPEPDYKVGDRVVYRGDEENIWTVNHIERGMKCWWVRASQHSVSQRFPAGVFRSIEIPRKLETTKDKKPIEKHSVKPAVEISKPKAPDRVLDLLSEAENLEQCWQIVALAGVDTQILKQKIGHLSNGLQRMGIGNHLRKMQKEGQFDPTSIIWTQKGFVKAL